MDIDATLLTTAERLFDRHGFNATGMGRLIEESGLSSRTVYKHITSKNTLMANVLAARQRRFFEHTCFENSDGLFDSLQTWLDEQGARGCLFFRIRAETGGDTPAIEAAVEAYHAELHARLSELVVRETGYAQPALADQLLALFEGATTAASYRGSAVIQAARACANQLLHPARSA